VRHRGPGLLADVLSGREHHWVAKAGSVASEVMTQAAVSCGPDLDVAAAARRRRDGAIGADVARALAEDPCIPEEHHVPDLRDSWRVTRDPSPTSCSTRSVPTARPATSMSSTTSRAWCAPGGRAPLGLRPRWQSRVVDALLGIRLASVARPPSRVLWVPLVDAMLAITSANPVPPVLVAEDGCDIEGNGGLGCRALDT
jgi:hypothetical protein